MSSASATALPMSTLDDDAWDDLLSFIEERRVIPIALLREAAARVDGLPANLRAVHDVRQWRERIHQAQQGVG